MKIYGKLTSGFGKGQYFTELDGYKTQIKKHLNFTSFPGTLNIIIKDIDAIYDILNQLDFVALLPFVCNGNQYGGCKCYIASIYGVACAIIIPDKTHHKKEILEIISSKNLRDTLSLKNGDEIEIKLDE
ncbi:MAG: CTP-dependent riboflavin kinase [Methanosarcinales archaeon]|jgi:riboflavin kinase|nr:CTP-dependent riboflavin kinase [Methanosarcinales archaeon]